MKRAPVFDEIYAKYLQDVSTIDPARVSSRLGLQIEGEAVVVPFYDSPYRVSGSGVTDANGHRPSHAVSVILCKYLLMCPDAEPESGTDWVTYGSFKDALPFAGGFRNTAEQPIAKAFSGRLKALADSGAVLGGKPFEAPFPADLTLWFPALPTVPLLMVFNDQDDEFPAQCSLFFERRAGAYLDMECLAMLGMVLASWLKGKPAPGEPEFLTDFE
ncbi:MAG: DUF3786 domain-containing protein [Desulfobacterales bacterium]